MVDKTHNYNTPKNYRHIPVPEHEECRRLRFEGVPYPNCKRYSIAFKLDENDQPGEVIKGWPGYAYECPIVPTWDEEGPWSILQTEMLTGE